MPFAVISLAKRRVKGSRSPMRSFLTVFERFEVVWLLDVADMITEKRGGIGEPPRGGR